MAETLPVATAKPKARARLRLNLMDALADAAIVWLRRYLPKNFGVDLEPPARAIRCQQAQEKRN